MTKNGFTLIELLMSVAILSIITMSLAEFSSNMFDVTFEQANALENVNQSRLLSDKISNELSKADYIFPAGVNITLDTPSESVVISTNSAVAYLVSSDSDEYYFLKAFYLVEANNGSLDLYYFISTSDTRWPENSIPASYFSWVSGSSGRVIGGLDGDINNIDYTLNPSNGVSDSILLGEVGAAEISDSNALIKGLSWQLSLNGNDFYIGGISYNVPRFLQ